MFSGEKKLITCFLIKALVAAAMNEDNEGRVKLIIYPNYIKQI